MSKKLKVSKKKSLVQEQNSPTKNKNKAVWNLVLEDMRARNKEGVRKYGTPLQAFNGRNSAIDAYQELLDLIVYFRQQIIEKERMVAMLRRYVLDPDVEELLKELGEL